MTAVPDDPRFSPEQRAALERIEAAQEAPEALRERVARAIYDEWIAGDWNLTAYQDHYRRFADAALAVLSPADVPDEPRGIWLR